MRQKQPLILVITPVLLASTLTVGEIAIAQEIDTKLEEINLNNTDNLPELISKVTRETEPESNASALMPVISVGSNFSATVDPTLENISIKNSFANYQFETINWEATPQNLSEYTLNPFPSNELARNPFLVADNVPPGAICGHPVDPMVTLPWVLWETIPMAKEK